MSGDMGGEFACYAHLLDEDGRIDERSTTFVLEPTPPYRLDLTAWALRRRAENVVDRWDDTRGAYERVIVADSGAHDVTVTQTGPIERPLLQVAVRGDGAHLLATRTQVENVLVRSLGLHVDLSGFYSLVGDDPFLGPLATRFRGVRPPRFHTWTEALTNAVSCQQLSLTVGIGLLNRLARARGSQGPSGEHAFPTAAQLASASPDELRAMGYSNRKAQVITEIAARIEEGSLDLESWEDLPDEEVRSRLCSLRGIGRWSAEYVMLRCLGRIHVFPGDDVGAQNKLRRLFGIDAPLDHAGVTELLERWAPYRGLVYFHLLLDGLADAGLVEPDT